MTPPGSSANSSARRPNVIIILADDMGYGDLSIYGNRLIETRHIDSIGREGVKFTAGYCSAPLCSPSRAGLVTGRYQQRFGFEQQVSSGAFPERREMPGEDGTPSPRQSEAEFLRRGIPLTEKLIGDLFKAQGYSTGVVGKWHLGHGPQFLPGSRGFDYSCVFYGNTSVQYTREDDPDILSFKVDLHDEAKDVAWSRHGLSGIRRNGQLIDVDQYLLHFFRDEAVAFVERHRAEPFMLYFAMNAPVPPLQVPRAYFEALRETIPNIHKRAYNGLVQAQDDAVGALLDRVRELGLERDTLIVFVSDNGCAVSRPGSNAPFSGGKFTTYEGGIRMPFLVKWPGHIQPGQVYEEPVSTLDILPTVAAACHVPTTGTQPLDGVNLLPYLSRQIEGAPHEVLFWKLSMHSAVRLGRWKLVMEFKNGIERLFDLLDDPQEKTDLRDRHPEVFADLKARYQAWDQTLPPRAWTTHLTVFRN